MFVSIVCSGWRRSYNSHWVIRPLITEMNRLGPKSPCMKLRDRIRFGFGAIIDVLKLDHTVFV